MIDGWIWICQIFQREVQKKMKIDVRYVCSVVIERMVTRKSIYWQMFRRSVEMKKNKTERKENLIPQRFFNQVSPLCS